MKLRDASQERSCFLRKQTTHFGSVAVWGMENKNEKGIKFGWQECQNLYCSQGLRAQLDWHPDKTSCKVKLEIDSYWLRERMPSLVESFFYFWIIQRGYIYIYIWIYSVVTYFYIINSHYLCRLYLLKQRSNRYFILSHSIHGRKKPLNI